MSISRHRRGRAWCYRNADGSAVTDADEIIRLDRVALPPAYTEGRFSPVPNGHIQAVGIDARGRRQYRYHPDFRALQDDAKFGRCGAFGLALPKLRAKVEKDLTGHPLASDTVIAAIVRILDIGFLRVGNEAYAKSNKSFGVTTLRTRHADLARTRLHLKYRAKSGLMRSVTLKDKAVARVVRHCQELRGQNLFQYQDELGQVRQVTSGDVNDYLRIATGADFTAKDFRTWGGSVIAYAAWCDAQRSQIAPGIRAISGTVAEQLGNTPTVARNSYIHPRVVEAVAQKLPCRARKLRSTRWLSSDERGLLQLLGPSG